MLSDLQHDSWRAKADPIKIANVMGQQGDGWNWTPFVFSALGKKYRPEIPVMSKVDLNTWKNLPEWAEEAPPPPPSHEAVTGEESREQSSHRILRIEAYYLGSCHHSRRFFNFIVAYRLCHQKRIQQYCSGWTYLIQLRYWKWDLRCKLRYWFASWYILS